MFNKRGKIIAIVGGPRSGKSFLATLLSRHYRAKLFLDGEEKYFPKRIIEDIKKNTRPLERILWFRNQQIKRHLKALEYKNKGKMVVIDTFWINYQLFIDVLTKGFERQILWELAVIDRRLLSWPDIVIFLNISEKGIRKFLAMGGRSFDQSEDFIKKQALPVNALHKKFFLKQHPKVLTINRDILDFTKQNHFKNLIRKIEKFK